MNQKLVTFQTALDVNAETPKAYKVLGGSWLPKSLVTLGPVKIDRVETREWNCSQGRRIGRRTYTVRVHIVDVTMPEWLANR